MAREEELFGAMMKGIREERDRIVSGLNCESLEIYPEESIEPERISPTEVCYSIGVLQERGRSPAHSWINEEYIRSSLGKYLELLPLIQHLGIKELAKIAIGDLERKIERIDKYNLEHTK
ncbi:MAG: hypothetical protein KJ592_01885 [Nanoarchaeota archaeon]|nr:hypothetical protein [Nanoarchaeota archaeon]